MFEALEQKEFDVFETFDPGEPTTAIPGSEEKIQVIMQRVQNGQPLWHEQDAVNYDGETKDEAMLSWKGFGIE